ncbi:MAG: HNH endonuclease [Bacillota bacterium]
MGRHLVALVDDEDYDRVARYRWYKTSRASGALYAQTRINGRSVAMHRFILNPPDGVEVDHRDGSGLNNQKTNLRLCARQQNRWHARGSRRWADGVLTKGISRERDRSGAVWLWYASITVNGIVWRAGPYRTRQEAMDAYDEAARRIFGEYAWTHAEGYVSPQRPGELVVASRMHDGMPSLQGQRLKQAA